MPQITKTMRFFIGPLITTAIILIINVATVGILHLDDNYEAGGIILGILLLIGISSWIVSSIAFAWIHSKKTFWVAVIVLIILYSLVEIALFYTQIINY
ncbi:MAG: hypothetical protein V1652_04415 [bacterium]